MMKPISNEIAMAAGDDQLNIEKEERAFLFQEERAASLEPPKCTKQP